MSNNRNSLLRRALLASVAVASVGLCASAAIADPVTVYVGYVDNLRASGFFPSLWLTSSGVVSQTPDGQSLDAGAIRLDNTTGGNITISEFTVSLNSGAQVFALWSDLIIGAGMTGIFTQTASYNFDTSDYGFFGGSPPNSLAPNNYLGNGNSNLIGGCSSSAALISGAGNTAQCAAAIPVISFKVDGVQFSFNDTGHIIDTGAWDFVNNTPYGEDGNESINWNLIGSDAVRGGTDGVPEPLTLSLFGAGLVGTFMARRRRKSS